MPFSLYLIIIIIIIIISKKLVNKLHSVSFVTWLWLGVTQRITNDIVT